jgi:hypothetical protein
LCHKIKVARYDRDNGRNSFIVAITASSQPDF